MAKTKTPNKRQGEDVITLGGDQYIVRMSLDAMSRLEVSTDTPYLQLFDRQQRRQLTIPQVVKILTAGINGGDNRTEGTATNPKGDPIQFTEAEVSDKMQEWGFGTCYGATGFILAIGVFAGEAAEGKPEAETD